MDKILSAILLLFWLCSSCDAPLSLSIAEAKRRALFEFGSLKDTSQISIAQVMQDSQHHWLVAYNNAQTVPAVYLFRAENAREHSHYFSLHHKQDAKVEKVLFEDVTYDGSLEMLVYLHFDYDLSYQGKELIIFKNPFDSSKQKEIFDFPLKQEWEHIVSFDSMYGVPKHHKRVENHISVSFFEGKMLMKGTINSRKHHILEYEWDASSQAFKKVLDEDLHEEKEELGRQGLVAKVKGTKILLEVAAHEEGCKAYIVEDVEGHVLNLPEEIHDALRCSRVTSLSENGRFLVFMNQAKNQLQLYDFIQDSTSIILPKLQPLEGVSELVWYQKRGRLDFAFVTIDMDEYEANSKIHVWQFRKDKKTWKEQVFNRSVFFDCDFDGFCAPHQQYDYRFSKAGNLLYRSQNTGQSTDDFLVLRLDD